MFFSHSRDHPRSRGEYPAMLAGDVLRQGSSPLSRGIPTSRSLLGPLLRIIPALAGNTPSRMAFHRSGRDHPRSRGEYWGAALVEQVVRRIIPALAGNTRQSVVTEILQ